MKLKAMALCLNSSWHDRIGQHSLPSFDHAVGDPVEDDIIIHAHHRVVLIEGLYVLLGKTTSF